MIAISPFAGWNVVGPWVEKHKNTNNLAQYLDNVMVTNYGPYSPGNPKLTSVSLDYKKIHAPVLLIQGTSDASLPWQTVQLLYSDMKPVDPNVELDLVPGGNHGLINKPKQLNKDISAWYTKYGEGSSEK
ncbi:alpha/beta hydrolase family protein [Alicyclobacillus fastidiosus]|uniref:alpha/beta hydrolase family protein n=1 Tax=Alicyclobacillus fastidiosus TaxID=392011 RepID=UPI0023E98638|nr:prolyl oligopeptidase family serine peptidase [Alicyclobacillus fastidiosus]GMA66062.1 hypothetical protein GCM10025859_65040 [Alicyclobacillus fastidiosus]